VSVSDLYYEEDGAASSPAVVLGSSLGTTHAMWEPVAVNLARSRRVVSYDHRGHGRSPLPDGRSDIADLGGDVLALLDRLELERVSYVGTSLGGMVGLWLAANAPQRIDRLVCVSSAAYLPPAQGWTARAARVREAGSVAAVADEVLARWFTARYAEAHGDVVEPIGKTLRECPAEGYASCCEVIERLDLRDQLSRITTPTLAIAAAEDHAIPPEHSRAIVAGVAGARFELLTHGAHLAAVECAPEVTALIERHLEEER
jgi:3-oxoadipate enol-lactonase